MSNSKTELKIQSLAPLFEAVTNNGNIALQNLRGKNVVLYFYPKDDTPGCTIEAQDFSKKLEDFAELDCFVLGVSRDSVASHCKFIEKYQINFSLIADVDNEICNKYMVIKEKSMFGKKYLGVDRSTFLIDKIGKIIAIWRNVSVKGHVEDILATLKEYQKNSN
jgi:peroxiredoxin Q/BCP